MAQGYIKLHRSLKGWEWRTSPKHLSVFLDLITEANHSEQKYRGGLILRGQLTTSYAAISERTGVSIRGVRTVIKDLKTTQSVTHQNMRHYSLITITNYDKYQDRDTVDDNLTTSRRQPNDNLTTTNKNVKNVKNNIYTSEIREIIDYLNQKLNKKYKYNSTTTIRVINARLNDKYNLQDFKRVIDIKYDEWFNDPEKCIYLRPETLFGNKFEGYLNQTTGADVKESFNKSMELAFTPTED